MFKALFGVLAAIAVFSVVSPTITGLLSHLTLKRQQEMAARATTATSTAAPAITIKPLSVRPVVSAYVTRPEQCPSSAPVSPDQPTQVCDVNKTAVYELKPEAMRLELTHVDSVPNPLTGVQMVEMTMTPDSARKFGEFTAGQVGSQLAFVRGGTVVWGPKITAPINGEMLQLSGDLTAEQAKKVATMIRDDS